jgi:hypothetical protein
VHLLVDSTGLKLCGAGEWLAEEHGTRRRRSWRKLHIGMDTGTGRIVAAVLTDKEADDGVRPHRMNRGEGRLTAPARWSVQHGPFEVLAYTPCSRASCS